MRQEDLGPLWEHLVLEHLQARFPDTPVRTWRDKAGHEVDFVLAASRQGVDAVECKWNPGSFEPRGLRQFRMYYPKGRNYLVTPSGDPAFTKVVGDLEVRVCAPSELGASPAMVGKTTRPRSSRSVRSAGS